MTSATDIRPLRTPDELRAFSEHLLYEVTMLCKLTERFAQAALGQRPPWEIENALLESLAIHARALVEFFYRDPGSPGVRRDDALATDYFEPGAWAAMRPELTDALEPVRPRAGSEIAHLTYRRAKLADEARGWRVGVITGDLGHVVTVFVRHCPPEHLRPDFRERAWEALPAFVRGHKDFYRPPAHLAWSAATQGLRVASD